jgi:cobalt/nickel transport system ATP-binding protein
MPRPLGGALGEPIFQLQKVSYSYDGNVTALVEVDLTMMKGESVAVLGANGSGKSTLLMLLDGLYFPTSGVIKAFGRSLSEEALLDQHFALDFRRRVGLVFQNSDVQLFSPTVWDEVTFAPRHLGLAKDEITTRGEEALRTLHLEHLRERAPYHLSQGEKKKVALASILSLNPEVWLLDEPTAGLDPRSESWLLDFIVQLSETGHTIITATHSLDIVGLIADKIHVLSEDNRLVAGGTPREILSDRQLLRKCNLSHEHRHAHKGVSHTHPHRHLHNHSPRN